MIVWPRGQKLHELGTPCPEYPGKFPEYPGCYNRCTPFDDFCGTLLLQLVISFLSFAPAFDQINQ